MRNISRFLISIVIVLTCSSTALPQEREVNPAHQTTSTTMGGTSTGLFGTFSARTLKKGEYTLGVFWNNFDRDPGDLDINRIPFNLTYGVTNRLELFANVDFFQQPTTRQPFFLSGSAFNDGRFANGGPGHDPFLAFGPPVGGRDGTAYFPNTFALGGGILPVIGAFAGNLGPSGLQPFNRPSFYNDLPFFPYMDAGGPKQSGNGLGNVTVGAKLALNDVDHWFSVAAAGLLRIPTTSEFDGLAQGRGAGELDGGPVLITSEKFFDNRLRFHQNVGYIFNGDPHAQGLKILDRRNELMLNTGLEWAPNRYMVYTGELNGTVYAGGGTPNQDAVNPLDLVIGARFFLCDGRFQFGGGWRTLLDARDKRTVFQFNTTTQALDPITIDQGDVNGFVVSLGYGRRPKRAAVQPDNRPPSVALDSDKNSVTDGEPIRLTARASDPDNDVLGFTWSSTAGRISGSGPTVTLDTAGINPRTGSAPVDLITSVTVDDGKGGTASATRSLRVVAPAPQAPPPPPANRPPEIDAINYAVVGTPQVEQQITDGETVRIWAIAHDPDNDPLTYQWSVSPGQITGRGTEVRMDTTGLTGGPGAPPVNVTVRLTVSDGRGGSDTDSRTLTVHSVRKPEATRLGEELIFPRNNARVNNMHKALLDDVALRLQQEPKSVLLIDGHCDKGEPESLAKSRAENVKKYLVRDKRIDPARIEVRSFGSSRPDPGGNRARNRRVELYIVPEGADRPQ
ncbi:MAG: OmpA family protein [Acidobacteria bacterium]|nr:OmpA family protein [Acidobacteriota bacterium]